MNELVKKPPYLPNEREVSLARESSGVLRDGLGPEDTAAVSVNGSRPINLPVSALNMLADVLGIMAKGDAVAVVPVNVELTTQQAADFLHVSRPYVVKLLEEGRLPFRRVGTRRRVLFQDLLAYQRVADEQSRRVADELTLQSQKLGLN